MITIILNHHNKYAEVDMPAMYLARAEKCFDVGSEDLSGYLI